MDIRKSLYAFFVQAFPVFFIFDRSGRLI